MGWDDDDEYPELDRTPEGVERRRRALGSVNEVRRRALRWAYACVGALIVVVILVATLR
jgi:hypothetical protein